MSRKQSDILSVETNAEYSGSEIRKKQIKIILTISNQYGLIILLLFFIAFIAFIVFLANLSFFGQSMHRNLIQVNQRLQKIDIKFHKFLFYIKHIYKSQKSQQQISQAQDNTIMNFLTKISQGLQSNTENQKNYQQPDNTNKFKKPISSSNPLEKTIKQDNQQHQKQVQLLSEKEMIDIAIKIIEEEKQNNSKHQKSSQNINQKQSISTTSQQDSLISQGQETLQVKKNIEIFLCQIDEQNIFYPNFQFLPQTQKLRKTKYGSSFQSIICQEPIPKSGIHDFSVKILRTSKSFIYIGIAGGNKSQIYNKTSIHEGKNFYGYSGYSGRIWEATKRKNSYEIFQPNSIFKVRINMDKKLVEYFFNDLKVGQSQFKDLCSNQCRFVIQMRDDGDQVQFLQTLTVDTFNITLTSKIDEL